MRRQWFRAQLLRRVKRAQHQQRHLRPAVVAGAVGEADAAEQRQVQRALQLHQLEVVKAAVVDVALEDSAARQPALVRQASTA